MGFLRVQVRLSLTVTSILCSASSPLSNYFPTTIKDPTGIVYQNSEQGYHHKCAEHFNDDISSTEILKAATPNNANKIGNSIKGRNESTWLTDETLAKNTMYRVCKMKFEQNLDLRQFLINTGTNKVVEASPVDKTWGLA